MFGGPITPNMRRVLFRETKCPGTRFSDVSNLTSYTTESRFRDSRHLQKLAVSRGAFASAAGGGGRGGGGLGVSLSNCRKSKLPQKQKKPSPLRLHFGLRCSCSAWQILAGGSPPPSQWSKTSPATYFWGCAWSRVPSPRDTRRVSGMLGVLLDKPPRGGVCPWTAQSPQRVLSVPGVPASGKPIESPKSHRVSLECPSPQTVPSSMPPQKVPGDAQYL